MKATAEFQCILRNAYKLLVRKPEGKRQLWRSRHR